MAFRYLVLTSSYRQGMNFTWESLKSTQVAYQKLIDLVRDWQSKSPRENISDYDLSKIDSFRGEFQEKISQDLNWPEGIAVIWKIAKSNVSPYDKLDLITDFDQVLGLKIIEKAKEKIEIPEKVKEMIKEREELRAEGEWKKSDEVRDKIKELGWLVEDTLEGIKIKQSN